MSFKNLDERVNDIHNRLISVTQSDRYSEYAKERLKLAFNVLLDECIELAGNHECSDWPEGCNCHLSVLEDIRRLKK
jgi:hypothetical protein